MEIQTTQKLTDKQFGAVNALWDAEFPKSLMGRFPLLVAEQTDLIHYVMEDAAGDVVAWATTFIREREIWFSIIIHQQYQGKGVGGKMMNQLKADNQNLNGWVIDHNEDVKGNGSTYQSPMPFYLKHGFNILSDIRIDTPMIKAVKITWKKHQS